MQYKKPIYLAVYALTLQLTSLNIAHAADALFAHDTTYNAEYAAQNNKLTTAQNSSISNLYSDVDMRMHLAAKSNMKACVAEECVLNQKFDAHVKAIGEQLANTAYEMYPNLKQSVPSFQFVVADKTDVGSASNGSGKIVLFRGLQNLELTDEALHFIIAREMGHVIAHHHSKNASTKLIITALASVIFPVAGIFSASSAAAQATTATTLMTSAASTATSMLGAQVAMTKMKPNQLVESDKIALDLLINQQSDLQTVVGSLEFTDAKLTDWQKDLQTSLSHLEAYLIKSDMALAVTTPSTQ